MEFIFYKSFITKTKCWNEFSQKKKNECSNPDCFMSVLTSCIQQTRIISYTFI